MARLPRPYIPIDVRLKVAERQLGRSWFIRGQSRRERLRLMLLLLFPNKEVFQLDHDPALENRRLTWGYGDSYQYYPDANDPDFLIYREKHAHYIKTNVRGDGAQYPDRVLAKRERRRQKNANRTVRKIPSRPFNNGST